MMTIFLSYGSSASNIRNQHPSISKLTCNYKKFFLILIIIDILHLYKLIKLKKFFRNSAQNANFDVPFGAEDAAAKLQAWYFLNQLGSLNILTDFEPKKFSFNGFSAVLKFPQNLPCSTFDPKNLQILPRNSHHRH